MTKHKDPHIEIEKPDFLDEIQESSYFQWLLDNRGALPYVFLVIIIIISLAFKFTSSKNVAEESNYLLAENYFSQLNSALLTGTESETGLVNLKSLEEIISAYPELQSKYDALVAQALITMEKPSEAKTFAKRTLERTRNDHVLYFNTFSETSLQISEGQYDKALENAKQLKNTILEKATTSFPADLFAYNLLRIAMLEEKAGSSSNEMNAWKEWKNYATGTERKEIAQAIVLLTDTFKEGSFTLNEYIHIRETALGKK